MVKQAHLTKAWMGAHSGKPQTQSPRPSGTKHAEARVGCSLAFLFKEPREDEKVYFRASHWVLDDGLRSGRAKKKNHTRGAAEGDETDNGRTCFPLFTGKITAVGFLILCARPISAVRSCVGRQVGPSPAIRRKYLVCNI